MLLGGYYESRGRKHSAARSCPRETTPAHFPRLLHCPETLRDYGGFIYEGEPIGAADRIRQVTDGLANLEALRAIFLLT
jgi:hypothetical protein